MSREAWGDPPDIEPECCPLCSSLHRTKGCPHCELDLRRHELEDRVNQLLGQLAAKELDRLFVAELLQRMLHATRHVVDTLSPGDLGYETRAGAALCTLFEQFNATLRDRQARASS